MKGITVIANFTMLFFLGYLLVKHGYPSGDEILLVVLMTANPFINLFYLFSPKSDSDSLISLYFQRKALEEKAKIEAIKKP